MRFKVHSNYVYTGGPDCLHQVAGAVKRRGYYSAMVYPPDHNGKGVMPYYQEIYDIDTAETRDENLDDPDTVQIIPANWGPDWYPYSHDSEYCIRAKGSNPYHSTKILYWVGWIPWQFWQWGGVDVPVDLKHPNMQKSYHACQTQKCYDTLLNSNVIKPERIFFLREHTVDVFFHSEEEIKQSLPQRQNIVLYNPVKGPETSKKIMEICQDLNCEFIPVRGMTHKEMAELGMKAKVYIDFGPYPGKEKIHREMAVCGCSIITGSDGCADNPIDVPSGNRKFFRQGGHYDWIAVKKQIIWDLENHSLAIDDLHMRYYRQSVRAEKAQFENDVDIMLQTIQTYGNLVD